MKVTKKELKSLITNFLKEDNDSWLGDEEDYSDLDLSPDKEIEAETKRAQYISKMQTEGHKIFFEENYDEISKLVDQAKKKVKKYFSGPEFSKVLEGEVYKLALEKQKKTKEKFISLILKKIDKAAFKFNLSHETESTLAQLHYPGNASKLSNNPSDKQKLFDLAQPYGERFKFEPTVRIYILNMFNAVASDQYVATGENKRWIELEKDVLYKSALEHVKRYLRHELTHIGNLHQIDLLASSYDMNPFYENLKKFFLTPETLFKNEKRNLQSAASNKDGPVQEVRDSMLYHLKEYLSPESGYGIVEIMERIQSMRMNKSLKKALEEWKNYNINIRESKVKYGGLTNLLRILDWDNINIDEIVKEFEKVGSTYDSISDVVLV